MGKKTGLGEDPLGWIVDTSKEDRAKRKPKPKGKRPKEVKLSILLREDQLETLEKLTKGQVTADMGGGT